MIKNVVRGLSVTALAFILLAIPGSSQVNAQPRPQVSQEFEACTTKLLIYRRGRRMINDPCVGRVQILLDQVKWVRGASGDSVSNRRWPTLVGTKVAGQADNLYGPDTRKAVIAYQAYRNGESGVIDGKVGPNTWQSFRNTCIAWANGGFYSQAC